MSVYPSFSLTSISEKEKRTKEIFLLYEKRLTEANPIAFYTMNVTILHTFI